MEYNQYMQCGSLFVDNMEGIGWSRKEGHKEGITNIWYWLLDILFSWLAVF